MASGADHYAAAEQMLALGARNNQPELIAEAQVHALLALTQATLVGLEVADWDQAVSAAQQE